MPADGLAGGLGRVALGGLAVAAAALLAFLAGAYVGAGFGIIVLFGLGWVVAAFSFVTLGAAVVAAALGKGRLPRWALALAALVLLAVGVVSALAFPATGEKLVVGLVAAACAAGVLAAAFAWRRA